MKAYHRFIWIIVCCSWFNCLLAQTDKASVKDTVKIRKHDPRIATRRSAIIPGWGQAYNREYWKIPLVYGVLAIPASLYFYNNSWYKKTKFAYEALYKASLPVNPDSSMLKDIDPQLKTLSIGSVQSYRNAFRRDRDYSILWFIIAWGLQVADATVFGHLKQFDISNDLSMEWSPKLDPVTRTPGLGFTLNLKNSASRRLVDVR
ncbi:hypothetical protein SAMN05444410_12327 [Hydrobacter penzbergensis]|jgi:hypothetical protein|uniref:DUF5683 domain-containing protein n=1 Tax=Hydrobacter penzbergensis TaxID=1235997 RepID=A0A8X8IJ76_9BACT|nr:DUF5683 domain-containing protein [Hydrobacter penzbergensis]MBN8721010.1 hypothetical protein [Sediminibacterium magnilacihabitans]PQV58007.1 hypothetical protein CLV53_12529 [Sediminibacterium magnilacihabitans]SDX65491.1 hypothetical protein SAMN05444410_12327 [Hydrobacter penzbergensis]